MKSSQAIKASIRALEVKLAYGEVSDIPTRAEFEKVYEWFFGGRNKGAEFQVKNMELLYEKKPVKLAKDAWGITVIQNDMIIFSSENKKDIKKYLSSFGLPVSSGKELLD